MNLDQRCERIEVLISDVDGVLTDGGLIIDSQGTGTKKFHVRDGLGIKLWQEAGFRFGIMTARTSPIVEMRASELDIDFIYQGCEEKGPALSELASQENISLDQFAYIGDDLSDLAPIRSVGLGVAVADAAWEVREAADHVTQLGGGHGAVRELVETILKSKGCWSNLLATHYGS